MRLTKTAAWSGGTAVVCVLLVVASWFLLVSPQRARAAEAQELTVAAQDRNTALESEIEQLKLEFADLGGRQAELAAIRQALPEEPALATFIRDVNETARAIGVEVDSITAGVPVPVSDPSAPGEPGAAGGDAAAGEAGAASGDPAGEDSASGGEDSASGEASTGGATGEQGAEGAEGEQGAAGEQGAQGSGSAGGGAATPDGGVVNGGGSALAAVPTGPILAALDVSVTMTGDYGSAALVLKDLQATMPRAFLVESVSVDAVTEDDQPSGTVELVVTGRVFVFVDDQAEPVTVEGAGSEGAGSELADPELADPELADPEGADPDLADPDLADPPADPGFAEQDVVGPDPEGPDPAVVGAGEQEGTS